MKINLISDTVTKPTKDMLEAMMRAEVGDDVFGQDPTVNALEEKVADTFGMEAALFCPSGTMTNQIAIQMHCDRLDEVICDHYSHVFQYETGGYAYNAGVPIHPVEGSYGKISPDQIEDAVKPDFDWLPTSKLVVIENTCNKGGGSIYTQHEIQQISDLCRELGLKLHLDGARIFNALVETGDNPKLLGNLVDSISICLSKGLGAPVGSLLIGGRLFIKKARKIRKVMGGGMRQAGYLAAAGIYALDNHIERLKTDHENALGLGRCLQSVDWVDSIRPIESNIIVFDLNPSVTSMQLLDELEKHGIYAAPFGPHTVRFVTHLDITSDMVVQVGDAIKEIRFSY